ncbi:MAG TPA: hypothetical protein VHA54_01535 [Solirubrobacterales bacterium]|nr:hypothetical protein [Solirubrobacterales bacterium]
MDILRNLFGSLASGIIRLLVAVGILAAAYFFLLRPVLDTANKGIDSANKSLEKSFGGSGLDDLGKSFDDVGIQIQRQVRRSLHMAQKEGNPRRLVKCIEHADGDARKIRRCTVKF